MTASTSSALPAFLRGIEPRARVLVRAQAGPALDDVRLLEAVREDFGQRAARLPLAEWPLRYWGLLLAREELEHPRGPTPDHPLYALGHTRRLALLLRLVVGLDPAGAARVMGLSETAYRALWADAEGKLEALGVGPTVLARWNEAFQAQVRGAAESPAVQAASPAPSGSSPRPPPRPPRRRWRPRPLQVALAGVLLLLVAVLGATFVWPPAPVAAPAAVGVPAGLAPSAARPPAERNLDAELVVDPDFALLASPPEAAWRVGVGFLSWWTAQTSTLPDPVPVAPLPALPWSALDAEGQRLLAPVQGAWDALDAADRAALRAHADTWRRLDPAARVAMREAYAGWLARPALERAALRAAFAEWMALDVSDREALSASAVAFAALAPEQQAAQRAAFDALDRQAQRDWALGPRLGAQLPGLRPLLAFVPAAEQAVLVAALEGLGDEARTALASRVAVMGTAQRAALRARVLAAPAAARTGLLAEAARAP